MARPSFSAWRTGSISATTNVPAADVQTRIMQALASYALRTAPDGTTF